MESIYDNESIPLNCEQPGCNAEFFRSVRELRQQPQIACPKCGATATVTDLDTRLADVVSRRLDRKIGVTPPTDHKAR